MINNEKMQIALKSYKEAFWSVGLTKNSNGRLLSGFRTTGISMLRNLAKCLLYLQRKQLAYLHL